MDEEQMRRFEASYDAYGAMIYRLAMVYLGRRADAEDVTQEVFCRLLWRAPGFADGEHEKRWLLQVTANLCKDQLKGFGGSGRRLWMRISRRNMRPTGGCWRPF